MLKGTRSADSRPQVKKASSSHRTKPAPATKKRRLSRDDVVRLVELFEGEVNNGGFHQFFFNSTGNETAEILQALEMIGARKIASILRRAASKFPGGMPPKDRIARGLLLHQIDPEIKGFDKLDKEFYSCPYDQIQGLLEKWAGWV